MPTKGKLKIADSDGLRRALDAVYDCATQQQVALWSLDMATRILALAAPEYLENEAVKAGLATNRLWQRGKARMHDVRQAGLRIHRLARECGDEKVTIALRAVGQAVATGHMKEHGMVASDYAIKYTNLAHPNTPEAVIAERTRQIQSLKAICAT